MRRPIAVACLGLLTACGPQPAYEARPAEPLAEGTAREAPCREDDPLGRALFGDLHVHTALSADAHAAGTRATLDDAYRSAFGGGPGADDETAADPDASVPRRRGRPLDFVAITDHAEYFGESRVCETEVESAATSDACVALRERGDPAAGWFGWLRGLLRERDDALCGGGHRRCATAAAAVWQEVVAAAERWNDTTPACERTTFPGYEYTADHLGAELHRSVVFGSAAVPSLPISAFEAPREWALWATLRAQCIDATPDCDVIAIPHAAPRSAGRLFATDPPDASEIGAQRARAMLRSRLEPVVEIVQRRGVSECRADTPGVVGDADPLCDFAPFEPFEPEGAAGSDGRSETLEACPDGWLADLTPHRGFDCVSPSSFVRPSLVLGLGEAERIEFDPFRVGFVGGTGAHDGRAAQDGPGSGGLTGVWADENSRSAIFAALRRREVFATSGPRIQVRFFGSHDYSEDLCDVTDPIEAASLDGVPMGGELPPRDEDDGPPVFFAWARHDPGTQDAPGALLQRMQIVKGWRDDEGRIHQRIVDVAGDADTRAGVDPADCAPHGPGFEALCATWRDPDWDPDRHAVYYARVIENPSCDRRASRCLAPSPEDRPADCAEVDRESTVQERAWSSPIWFSP